MTITQSAQKAVNKLRALKEPTEVQQLQIVQDAIDAETNPLHADRKNTNSLTNQIQEQARLDAENARQKLSDKDTEIAQLRDYITRLEARAARQTSELAEKDALIASLRSPKSPVDDADAPSV